MQRVTFWWPVASVAIVPSGHSEVCTPAAGVSPACQARRPEEPEGLQRCGPRLREEEARVQVAAAAD